MRGSIWTVAALALALALLPPILDIEVASGDAAGETAMTLLTLWPPVLGLLVFVAGIALLLSFLSADGF